MRFQYAPELVEEIVFQGIQRQQEKGNSHFFDEYHQLADRIYEDFPPFQREAEFDKLHRQFFVKLGFADLIFQAIREFKILVDRVEQVFVGKALSSKEEGADLSRDGMGIGIKLRTDRFWEVSFLRRYLRHELMHVADMFDEAFGYEYHARLSPDFPAAENIARERYSVLWDIYIDSRISREGRETVTDQSQRFREFAALYKKLPDDWIPALFEVLWSAEHFTHRELLEMAQDVHHLLAHLPNKVSHDEHLANQAGTNIAFAFLPGSPCPLCRFPTYTRIDDTTQLLPHLRALVAEDFPDWRPEQGMCERCFEGYQVRTNQRIRDGVR